MNDPSNDPQNSPVKRKFPANWGAPKGNANAETHGIVAWKQAVKRIRRKGRDIIDKRCIAGQLAIATRDALIEERGGADNLSVAQLILIELVGRDIYFCDEIDRRIMAVMHKLREQEKATALLGKTKYPKAIGILYGYRSAIANNLSRNLMALGLDKPPPKVQTLAEILESEEDPGG